MNWKHSYHEILILTLGQSFTIDEAYRLLNEQREDRLFSIASAKAESKRAQAKVIDAEVTVRDYNDRKESKSNLRRAEASILETSARFLIAQPCLDMARAELAFIEALIDYIDSNNLRIHQNFAVGCQLVQPMELAFEYIWSLLYDGSSSGLMRNIYAHPDHEKILRIASDEALLKHGGASRKAISERLAAEYQLPVHQLAVTVNTTQLLQEANARLGTYAASLGTSLIGLREKSTNDDDTPRSAAPRVGAES